MGFVGEKEGWMVWAWIGQSGNGLHRVAFGRSDRRFPMATPVSLSCSSCPADMTAQMQACEREWRCPLCSLGSRTSAVSFPVYPFALFAA